VPPVASYASELWACRTLPGRLGHGRISVRQISRGILRQICGLRSSTPGVIVLSECDQQPLADLWVLRTVRFWNLLVGLPATSFYKQVALADCRDAVQHNVHNCIK